MKRWVGEREAVWDGLVERCGLRATSLWFVDAIMSLSPGGITIRPPGGKLDSRRRGIRLIGIRSLSTR